MKKLIERLQEVPRGEFLSKEYNTGYACSRRAVVKWLEDNLLPEVQPDQLIKGEYYWVDDEVRHSLSLSASIWKDEINASIAKVLNKPIYGPIPRPKGSGE